MNLCDVQQLSLMPIVLEAEAKKKRLLSMNSERHNLNYGAHIGVTLTKKKMNALSSLEI